MYLYLYKNLKRFCTDASKRLTPAPLNKISLTLSHKSVLSVTTITISVLSLTSKRPSLPLHSAYKEADRPGSAVLRSSSVSWNGSVGQAERRWLKSKLTVHKQIYDSIKQIVTNLVDKAKQAYYSAKIQSSTTCKQLFQNFNTILGKSRSSLLPSTFDSDDLTNVFSDYFTEKIRTIRNYFPPPNLTACPDTSFAGNPLLTFESVTDEFVLKIINSASAKSCELDPIPTTLLYENLDILLPTITNIINTSLTTGIVPPDLKTATVKPLLKKPSLDKKNFWKTTVPFLTYLFCPKFLKKSFSTNFCPISKKTTSAIPFSQPIEQDAALRPFCYVL